PRHPPCTLSHLTIQPERVSVLLSLSFLFSLLKSENKQERKQTSMATNQGFWLSLKRVNSQ
ncbi:hypothetical protein LRP52_49760, partial [Photobacterium sp. ZSDE20]|nr:hypothetical protein [Photobacterium sp. ZSDE20]